MFVHACIRIPFIFILSVCRVGVVFVLRCLFAFDPFILILISFRNKYKREMHANLFALIKAWIYCDNSDSYCTYVSSLAKALN